VYRSVGSKALESIEKYGRKLMLIIKESTFVIYMVSAGMLQLVSYSIPPSGLVATIEKVPETRYFPAGL